MKNIYETCKGGIKATSTLVLWASACSLSAQTITTFASEKIVEATFDGQIVPMTLSIEKCTDKFNGEITLSSGVNYNFNEEQTTQKNKSSAKLLSAADACDTVSNILANDGINIITYYTEEGTTGFLGGTGILPINRFAEEYDITGSLATHLQYFTIKFTKAVASTDTGKFKLVMWKQSDKGKPGQVLGSIPINYKTVQDAIKLFGGPALFTYSFQKPVALPSGKIFYIGTEAGKINTDTLAIGLAMDTTGNTSWSNVLGSWKPVHETYVHKGGPMDGLPGHTRAWINAGITNRPVTVYPTPLSDTICPGSAIQFNVTGNNAVNYIWIFQGGNIPVSFSQNPQVTYDTPGQFFYNIQGFNSCGFSHSRFGVINVDSLNSPNCDKVGIAEEQNTDAIRSYFNAESSTLKIIMGPGNKGMVEVSIYNNLGQHISTEKIQAGYSSEYSTQLRDLNRGIYFVRIVNSNTLHTNSFIFN